MIFDCACSNDLQQRLKLLLQYTNNVDLEQSPALWNWTMVTSAHSGDLHPFTLKFVGRKKILMWLNMCSQSNLSFLFNLVAKKQVSYNAKCVTPAKGPSSGLPS